VGRFVSRDSFGGFAVDPLSLHRFTYVENSPVTVLDPSGNVPVNLNELNIIQAMQAAIRAGSTFSTEVHFARTLQEQVSLLIDVVGLVGILGLGTVVVLSQLADSSSLVSADVAFGYRAPKGSKGSLQAVDIRLGTDSQNDDYFQLAIEFKSPFEGKAGAKSKLSGGKFRLRVNLRTGELSAIAGFNYNLVRFTFFGEDIAKLDTIFRGTTPTVGSDGSLGFNKYMTSISLEANFLSLQRFTIPILTIQNGRKATFLPTIHPVEFSI
jgi:hypothetical protein